jgi:hypothetical protein
MKRTKERDLLLRMVANFPGLALAEVPVNGGDLVEWISSEVFAMLPDNEIFKRALYGTEEDECYTCD